MKVEIQQTPQNKSQPPLNTNAQEIEKLVASLIQKYLSQTVQQPQQSQKIQQQTSQQSNTNMFIIKAGMKSSMVAIKVENMLLTSSKEVVLQGVGYAVPILLDSILLIRKDLQKQGKDIHISLEIFEKSFSTDNKQKTVSGLRAVISLK